MSAAAPRARGYFVTGTDTGVGKTRIACALLQAFAREGLRAIGMKPVAAGADRTDGVLVNEDVSALEASANVAAPRELVNPYCFAPPIAPHIAAAQAGVTMEIERIVTAYRALEARADVVIVEGAGGFRVPLTPVHDMSALAAALGLPVVLVVGMRLGCLNHALLSADAIRAAGLPLCAWVANHADGGSMAYADENVAALEARLGAPLLARFGHAPASTPAQVARDLDLSRLRASGV